jgi:hypothetical protein
VARRQITSAVTMLVLIGILVLGAVWGWRSLFAELPETEASAGDEPAENCTTELVDAGEKLRSRQVRVSVFNAGTRAGLAGQTLDALIDRGFLAGQIGNAPSDLDVRRVQVWSTVEDDPAARLVARQFGKKVKVRYSDEDLGTGVDVIVGDRFNGLKKAPRAIAVKTSREVCVPVDPADEPLD